MSKFQKFKKSKLYRELWYFYYHCIVYRKPHEYAGYLYGRFWLKRRIRRSVHPLDSSTFNTGYTIHLLCGHRDVDMLLWALASWHRVVRQSGAVYIHEDGSFTPEDRMIIARLLPHATIIDFEWAQKMLRQWLKSEPQTLELREKYRDHILIIKLIDPRFASDAPTRLILDTDILWFEEPVELLDALAAGKTVFQYGGPTNEPMTQFKDGSFLREDLQEFNSGMVAYNVSHYLLKDLEAYCSTVDASRARHFIEQSGYAWILSRGGAVSLLDKNLYTVRGAVTEHTVAKHFTGPRREDFWREGVRVLAKKLL